MGGQKRPQPLVPVGFSGFLRTFLACVIGEGGDDSKIGRFEVDVRGCVGCQKDSALVYQVSQSCFEGRHI